MPFKLSFSKVVIIESLEDHEVKTGLQIKELISGLIAESNKETPVEYLSCESAIDFKSIVSNLKSDVDEGLIPLVHIECHGDILEGLEFKNGSTLAWGALAEIIWPLNLATGFNLVLCMSACHAGAFLGEMGKVERPCPCRVMIAPSLEVNAAECMAGFRTFYNEFFSSLALGEAVKKIELMKLDNGQWFGESAERWFIKISRDYIRTQCSPTAIRGRAIAIHENLMSNGINWSIERAEQFLLDALRRDSMNIMYKKYFAIEENSLFEEEFNHVLIDIRNWIDEQRELDLCAF